MASQSGRKRSSDSAPAPPRKRVFVVDPTFTTKTHTPQVSLSAGQPGLEKSAALVDQDKKLQIKKMEEELVKLDQAIAVAQKETADIQAKIAKRDNEMKLASLRERQALSNYYSGMADVKKAWEVASESITESVGAVKDTVMIDWVHAKLSQVKAVLDSI